MSISEQSPLGWDYDSFSNGGISFDHSCWIVFLRLVVWHGNGLMPATGRLSVRYAIAPFRSS